MMQCRVLLTIKLRVEVSEEKPVAALASEIAGGRQTMVATAGDQSDEERRIVIGHIEPIGGVAIASEGWQTLAMLRRRNPGKISMRQSRLADAGSAHFLSLVFPRCP